MKLALLWAVVWLVGAAVMAEKVAPAHGGGMPPASGVVSPDGDRCEDCAARIRAIEQKLEELASRGGELQGAPAVPRELLELLWVKSWSYHKHFRRTCPADASLSFQNKCPQDTTRDFEFQIDWIGGGFLVAVVLLVIIFQPGRP